jgi:hypothetical protein
MGRRRSPEVTRADLRRHAKYIRKEKYGNLSKRESQQLHARRRFRERYGIHFNRKKERDLVRQIKQGSATYCCRQSARVYVYYVMLEGYSIPVVYDRTRDQVVTCLPQDFRYEDICT